RRAVSYRGAPRRFCRAQAAPQAESRHVIRMGPCPRHHRSGAILSLGNDALELSVFEWMIFRTYGQTLFGWVHGRPFRNRPGYKNAIDRQSAVVVKMTGSVFLNDEDTSPAVCSHPPCRLGGFGEFSFPAIIFEWHSRYSSSHLIRVGLLE